MEAGEVLGERWSQERQELAAIGGGEPAEDLVFDVRRAPSGPVEGAMAEALQTHWMPTMVDSYHDLVLPLWQQSKKS